MDLQDECVGVFLVNRVGVVGTGEVNVAVAVSSQDSSHSVSAVNFAVSVLRSEVVLEHDLIL